MKELLNHHPDLLITVVGIGGCGCNTINMLNEFNFSNSVNLIAVNTDLAVLNHIKVNNKILIGENLTHGYGAGADPAVGLKAAQESQDALKNAIQDSDIVIITAGFGGGTGTGASPLVAQIANELMINSLAIVTLPFESEGQMRLDFAQQGITAISEVVQGYITLSNDLLLKGLGENVGLFSAFNQSNEVLKNLLSALVQLLTKTGFINIDLNDFNKIMSYEGESVLGVGKADSEEQAFAALEQALTNPLVSFANIESAQGVILYICCQKEPSLATYQGLIEQVRTKLSNNTALVLAGVALDTELSSEIEILLIASGITGKKSNHSPVAQNLASQPLSYLDDELSFVKNTEFTDIPAIVRKMQQAKK